MKVLDEPRGEGVPTAPKASSPLKWVLMGCGTLLLLLVLFVAGIFFVATSAMKSTDAYKQSFAQAKANPELEASIGSPMEEGTVSGSVNATAGEEKAKLSYGVSGPKGKGTIYVDAHKASGVWVFDTLEAEVDGKSGRISLAK